MLLYQQSVSDDGELYTNTTFLDDAGKVLYGPRFTSADWKDTGTVIYPASGTSLPDDFSIDFLMSSDVPDGYSKVKKRLGGSAPIEPTNLFLEWVVTFSIGSLKWSTDVTKDKSNGGPYCNVGGWDVSLTEAVRFSLCKEMIFTDVFIIESAL